MHNYQALSKKYVKLPKRGKIPNNFYSTSPTNLISSSLASEFLQRIQIQETKIFFFLVGGGEGGLEYGGWGGEAKCKIINMSHH